MLEINNIYNEDCLIGMEKISPASIDLVLCDIPYGITNCKWDKPIDLERMWDNLKNICKNTSTILFFSQMPFSALLVSSNLKMFKYNLIWDKKNPTGHLNAKKCPLRSHEEINVFYKNKSVYNPQFSIGSPYKAISGKNGSENYGQQVRTITNNIGKRYPKSILTFVKEKKSLHPTQKPISICEYLIKTYSNENDTVLDFCMGSGTTAIAAINTQRNFIGFEKDKNYCDLSLERIKDRKNAH